VFYVRSSGQALRPAVDSRNRTNMVAPIAPQQYSGMNRNGATGNKAVPCWSISALHARLRNASICLRPRLLRA